MKCKAVRVEIEERERAVALSADAKAHLLVCAQCRAFADEQRALLSLIGSLESVSAPPDFDWRLRARLAGARTENARGRLWPFSFAPSAQAITLAASFALLLVGLLVYQQMKSTYVNGTKSAAIASADDNKSKATPPSDAINTANESNDSTQTKENAGDSRAGLTARTVKSSKTNRKPAENASPSMKPRIYSNDFGSLTAQEISPAGLQGYSSDVGPLISVPMRSTKPASLRFEDEQGTKRSLPTVNFGAQEQMGRTDAARLVPASEKGIW